MANLITSPEDFTTGWSGILAGTVESNQAVAPDGTSTADRLVDDGLGGNSSVIIETNNITVSTSTAYTFSVFSKADQLDWLRMVVVGFTTPTDGGAYFDLTNGAKGTLDAQFDDFNIEAFSSGWYRAWIVFTTDSTDTAGRVRLYVAEADGDATVARDGTSSIYIWGAYLNEGASPEAYVSQAGITVTNSAPKIARGVTRNVTRNVTKNLIDF